MGIQMQAVGQGVCSMSGMGMATAGGQGVGASSFGGQTNHMLGSTNMLGGQGRSEERRVGKESRARGSTYHQTEHSAQGFQGGHTAMGTQMQAVGQGASSMNGMGMATA